MGLKLLQSEPKDNKQESEVFLRGGSFSGGIQGSEGGRAKKEKGTENRGGKRGEGENKRPHASAVGPVCHRRRQAHGLGKKIGEWK